MRRLWCIIEVFTFLKMGGSIERVTMKVISLAEREVWCRFDQFEVQKATCFKADERQKLLAALESGFGSFEAFNSLVSNMFKDKSGAAAKAAAGGYERMSDVAILS